MGCSKIDGERYMRLRAAACGLRLDPCGRF
jgi:hypothetical protein